MSSLNPHRRALIAGSAAALSGFLLSGCEREAGVGLKPADFNFRLSLTMDFDGVRIVGSSVQKYLWRGWSSELASTNRTVTEMVGEGAVADFGDRGVVVSTFFQLEPPDFRREPSPHWGRRRPLTTGWPVADVLGKALLPPIRPDQSTANWWLPLSGMATSRPVDVPFETLPLVIWFPDRTAAGSVRRIDVGSVGEGPRIVEATVAITTDTLTDGRVEAALPWFASYLQDSLYLSGKPTDRLDGSVAGLTHTYLIKRGLPS